MGIVAEPVGVPADVAERLADDLPDLLSRQLDDGRWRVETCLERLPPSDADHQRLLEHSYQRLRERGWDVAVCITDLPMRGERRPLVADADTSRGVAVVSLPAFGGMRLGARVRRIVYRLVAELSGREIGRPPRPFRRVEPADDGVDLRIVASRRGLRVLIGMVRANRPWRLILGLTKALAAALAVGAYIGVNPTDWSLAIQLGPWKLAVAMLFAIAAMVCWLIVDHNLWEHRSATVSRERARLYNASTVATLVIGVLCMYAGIYAVLVVAYTFLMDQQFFAGQVGTPLRPGHFFIVPWLAASLAVVAGALGTGFESEEAVREAAYSYRERERRERESEAGEEREE